MEEGRTIKRGAPTARPSEREYCSYKKRHFGCDLAYVVLRRRNFSAELHRPVRNFLSASPQSNRDKRCGENDGALHSLDLLCCPPAPPALQSDLLGNRNIRRTLHTLHGLCSITLFGSHRELGYLVRPSQIKDSGAVAAAFGPVMMRLGHAGVAWRPAGPKHAHIDPARLDISTALLRRTHPKHSAITTHFR
jgi:hypothetical protein